MSTAEELKRHGSWITGFGNQPGYWLVEPPEFPFVKFYISESGITDVSERECWVSVRFDSFESAKSWANDLLEAEIAFKELNAATGGKGPKVLGKKP